MALTAIVILLATIVAASAIAPTGYPTTISYDKRAFTINGTRQLLLSGCVHYPRSTPSEWPNILKLTKDAGIDVVQTYVFWNLHQPTSPDEWFFDGRANMWDFLELCQKTGLFVNLRIGPYVCAEWTLGGIPVWVKNIPGIVFRDHNPQWLSAMQKFVSRIVTEALQRKLFSHQGGPIIMSQIENEYGNVEGDFSDPHGYVNWAVQLAQNLTNKEPWIMCAQDDAPNVPGVVNTCNGFYCDNWLPGHFSSRNTPGAWTENWPGWFQNWGSPKIHRPVQDVAFAVARWFARGGAHMNYYMWHGGTTFGRYTGGPLLVTSYDYDVALNEYGLPHNPKYSHSAALHKVLQDYAHVIVNNPVDPGSQIVNNLFVNVYGSTSDKSNCVAFLSNIDNQQDITVTWNGNSYKVPAWSVSILGGCGTQVTFNTATVAKNPVSNVLSENKKRADSNSWQWSWWRDSVGPWNNAKVINHPTPLEQISLTNDLTDYLWYSVNLESSSSSQEFTTNVHDFALIFVNDKLQATMRGGDGVKASLSLPSGKYTLNVLSQTVGLANYGGHYESHIHDGIGGKISVGQQDITTPSGGWNHVVGLMGESLRVWTAEESNKVPWNSTTSLGLHLPLTWWKASFPTPSGDGPLAIDITGLTKGFIYVNEQGIGRYWNIVAYGSCPSCSTIDAHCDYRGNYSPDHCQCDCGVPSQQFYHVPRDWLKAVGEMNTLVLLEEVGAEDVSKVTLGSPFQ